MLRERRECNAPRLDAVAAPVSMCRRRILFPDVRNPSHMVRLRLQVFECQHLILIADTYHQWRNLRGNYADAEGYYKADSLAEVEVSGYVLSPGRYVGSATEEGDCIPFEEKKKALTGELAKLYEEAVLEKRISGNMEGIVLR